MRVSYRSVAFAGMTLAALVSTGCPTVDLGDVPPDPGQCRPDFAYFRDVVWPEYIAPQDPDRSCVDAVGCHRANDGRSGFRMSVAQGGQGVDFQANYDGVVFFLNCNDPSASRLLTKPLTGVLDHAGGDLFAPGSASETVFLDWFSQ
ncbi:hypothetical protein [Haliangium sp.]|uniref:hypothetical protein n=1 Tax=Haliangium sp. TaxID=2663208 RepID=UPI003D0B6263